QTPWNYNCIPENWTIQSYAPTPCSANSATKTRRLLHVTYMIAFWCLLRGDEVLKIQVHNIETSEKFLEVFRNNLLDIGYDSHQYDMHFFHHGGCQWLASGCRWLIRQVYDWAG
ncbi:hypothetical protein A0H81_08354, partial [Grifola frondosa]